MAYQYDVFISYSSARRGVGGAGPEQSLAAAGLKVFRDQTRLAAGDKWDSQLREAISGSQHLVALWSDRAKDSDWVQRELYRFDALSEGDPSRRLILLNLQGQNKSLTAFQAIDELNSAERYAAGVGAVEVNLWNEVIRKIATAVRRQRRPHPRGRGCPHHDGGAAHEAGRAGAPGHGGAAPRNPRGPVPRALRRLAARVAARPAARPPSRPSWTASSTS